MIIAFFIILLFPVAVIISQHQRIKRQNAEISYITGKLKEIKSENTTEQIKVVTEDRELKGLIVEINERLEQNIMDQAEYKETKESMRKMLSNISHDLKTPLTVVLGYLEMLTLKSDNVKEVSMVYQKVQEVMELINRFFDLAKLEAGDKEYPLSNVNISEIARQSILSFTALLEKADAKIEIEIPEQEYYVVGNEEAMLRILNNLVSNALKYGMDGRYLAIKVVPDKQFIKVEVTDHGHGIPKNYQRRIFERLYTLEDSRSSKYQGNGLGLTITEHLVTAMHGTITLHSIPYEKTTFALQFPRSN